MTESIEHQLKGAEQSRRSPTLGTRASPVTGTQVCHPKRLGYLVSSLY